MSIAMTILLSLQVISGAIWTISFAMAEGQGSFSLLGVLFLLFPIHAIGFLVGLLVCWLKPDLRRQALWAVALPFISWFLPLIIKRLLGGPLTDSGLLYGLQLIAILVVAFCVVMPGKAASFVPGFLFRSRAFNSLVLIGPIVGWLVLAVILLKLFVLDSETTARSMRNDSTGYGLASLIVVATIYLAGLGVVSIISGAWAWLGLRGGVNGACRKLNVAQLVAAAPGLLLGGLSVLFLINQQ